MGSGIARQVCFFGLLLGRNDTGLARSNSGGGVLFQNAKEVEGIIFVLLKRRIQKLQPTSNPG